MGFLDSLAEYVTDRRVKPSRKFSFVFLVIITVILVDNIIGFSSHYQVDRKIGQIERLNRIVKDSSNDASVRTYAAHLRNEIIESKTVVGHSTDFLTDVFSKSPARSQAKKPTPVAKETTVAVKNNFWFNFSAAGLYFLTAIVTTIVAFVDKKTALPQRLAMGITTFALFALFGLFFIWLFGLIPQISSETWAWNYVLNIILQIAIASILVWFTEHQKKVS